MFFTHVTLVPEVYKQKYQNIGLEWILLKFRLRRETAFAMLFNYYYCRHCVQSQSHACRLTNVWWSLIVDGHGICCILFEPWWTSARDTALITSSSTGRATCSSRNFRGLGTHSHCSGQLRLSSSHGSINRVPVSAGVIASGSYVCHTCLVFPRIGEM